MDGKLIALCGLPLLLLFGARRRTDPGPAQAGETPLERAARVVQTLDPAKIRAEAARLRREGEKVLADALDNSLELVRQMREAKKNPAKWPEGADPMSEPELRDPPIVLSQDDLMVAAWMKREDNHAPPFVTADLYPDRGPTRRHLTPRERWFLGPYFPVISDLDMELVFDSPEIPGWSGDMPDGGKMYAVTLKLPSERAPCVYFPNGPQSMLSRWWMSVLAHELVHGSQVRIGMTGQQSTGAMIRWGYELSPVEVQARYFQRVVQADLARRARMFYLERGPMPQFP